MFSIDWQLAAAIATVFSSVAFAVSAIAVMIQLRQMTRERYFSVTAHLFDIWQSPEFQRDQLFLLHEWPVQSWEEFCAQGRGKRTERAIHRVGGYYDRVGNLVRHNLIDKEEILPTIGGYAVAVWYQIQPLVKEMRLRENAVLFQNYESLLPECHECYVPGLERRGNRGAAAEIGQAGDDGQYCAVEPPSRPEPIVRNGKQPNFATLAAEERSRSEVKMATEQTPNSGSPVALGDLMLPDSDGIGRRLSDFTAAGPAVLVYARGAYCPFCLRQLSDYAERYHEFKRIGVEVVALSPESQRKSRRLRTGLGLPFTVLSDAKFEAAKRFGLMDHEHPGVPTPATLMLDSQQSVWLSTLNEGVKSLFAGDVLKYAHTLKAGGDLPTPTVASPRPAAAQFVRAMANMAVGAVTG